MKGCEGCTSCCEVIGVGKMSKKYESYLKDTGSIPKAWKRLTRFQAKKMKPYLFYSGIWGSNKVYFECSNLTDEGCSIHKSSPFVCSGYPYYGKDLEELISSKGPSNQYSEKPCNLHEGLEEVDSLHEYNKWVGLYFTNFVDQFPDRVHEGWDSRYKNLIQTVEVD